MMKHGGSSIWLACFLEEIRVEKMGGAENRAILEENMFKNPKHSSRTTLEWLRFRWPSQSPDLNTVAIERCSQSNLTELEMFGNNKPATVSPVTINSNTNDR